MRRFRVPGFRPGGVPSSVDAVRTSILQAKRQRNGAKAEELVEARLKARGFVLVEKVEVPFRINKATGQMSARKKVSGDFRAVGPGGLSVLIEVKHHEERLSHGAFREHQLTALEEHHRAGGISEVAWVDRGLVHFIPWHELKAMGFGPRTSIHFNGARIALYTPTRGKRGTSSSKAAP